MTITEKPSLWGQFGMRWWNEKTFGEQSAMLRAPEVESTEAKWMTPPQTPARCYEAFGHPRGDSQ